MNTTIDDLVPCCSFCGSEDMDDLGMIPSLDNEGKVLAFIFVCSEHFDRVAGKATTITFSKKDVAPQTWDVPEGTMIQ